tara:strand:- start:135540 stop:136085 length:546 start_codon:yes stop_codon:yes gene_type:complete
MFHVEHKNRDKMLSKSKMYKLIVLPLCCFLFLGCENEDPNPELRDRIYLDLKQDYEASKAALEEFQGYFKESQEKLDKTQPHSVERVATRRDIKKRRAQIRVFEKQTRYLRIRMERRMYESRKAYKLARMNGTKWPDPEEFRFYIVNKKLVKADLNWNNRVPKLFDKSSQYDPKDYKVAEE